MFNFEKEIKDLNLINRDINLFGKVYVEKLKKLKILVYGLRPVKYIKINMIFLIFYENKNDI